MKNHTNPHAQARLVGFETDEEWQEYRALCRREAQEEEKARLECAKLPSYPAYPRY